MNWSILAACAVALSLPLGLFGQNLAPRNTTAAMVLNQQAGPTPFIGFLSVSTGNINAFRSIQFEVVPKPGSVTRPISATYFADYLRSRGYLDSSSDRVTVPVFGLYAGYTNTVNLTYRFTDGSVQTGSVTVTTPVFNDVNGYNRPTVLQARTASTQLSYDYIILKSAFPASPVIIDTDGIVRWVGTTGQGYLSSIFIDNSFFVATLAPATKEPTVVTRLELDGTYVPVRDYAADGVTSVGHHNYDPGRDGILVEANTIVQTESVLFEIDFAGNVLKTWDLGAILRATMIAGGDDPTGFVYDAPFDWFHNNSATYRRVDNTLLVSSRESFVIALDYDTGAIRWILGDPTKQWYQYPSLRKYALALAPGTLPPIGQHSLSITHDNSLLLFDNGRNSGLEYPPGEMRTYSSPRRYLINTEAMYAAEVWNYQNARSIYSPFTSSVYEDGPLNYFINYADITFNDIPTYAEFLGLTPSGEKVFDYRYPINQVGNFAWNALPIHLENLVFTGPQEALAPGHPAFFTGETPLTNGVYFLSFPTNGNTFGYYSYLADSHYIYHFGLGYEYWFDAADSQRGVYFYDFASGSFFYTSPQFPFPYLYDCNLGTVLYYFAPDVNATGAPRYFYDFATGQIITK